MDDDDGGGHPGILEPSGALVTTGTTPQCGVTSDCLCGWLPEHMLSMPGRIRPPKGRENVSKVEARDSGSKARKIQVLFRHHQDTRKYIHQYRYNYTYSMGPLSKLGIDIGKLDSVYVMPSADLAPLRGRPKVPEGNRNESLTKTDSEPNILHLRKYYNKGRELLLSEHSEERMSNSDLNNACSTKCCPEKKASTSSKHAISRKISMQKTHEGHGPSSNVSKDRKQKVFDMRSFLSTTKSSSSHQMPPLAVSHIRGDSLRGKASLLSGKAGKAVGADGCTSTVKTGSVSE